MGIKLIKYIYVVILIISIEYLSFFFSSYAVITGLIEILSRRIQKVRESIESNKSVMLSLLTTLGFLSRFIDVCQPGESH